MRAVQMQKLTIVSRVAARVAAILQSKWRADGHCDGCGITLVAETDTGCLLGASALAALGLVLIVRL